MTPTEQDKKIIRSIEKALEKSFSYQVLVLNKECRDELMQLITADRKHVALQARIDEATRGLGLSGKYEHRQYFAGRIAELKAQQEDK